MPLWRTVALLLMLPGRNELLARGAGADAVAAAIMHGAWILQPLDCHREAAGRAGCAARGTGITVGCARARGRRQRLIGKLVHRLPTSAQTALKIIVELARVQTPRRLPAATTFIADHLPRSEFTSF